MFNKKLTLKVVKRNRYLDVGDWLDRKVIAVEHDDPRSTAAVLLHELVEYILCTYADITASDVDRDDRDKLTGKIKYNQTCYWQQHLVALECEQILVKALGLTWQEHEKCVAAAINKQRKLFKESKNA